MSTILAGIYLKGQSSNEQRCQQVKPLVCGETHSLGDTQCQGRYRCGCISVKTNTKLFGANRETNMGVPLYSTTGDSGQDNVRISLKP